jgi:hypothetical protein
MAKSISSGGAWYVIRQSKNWMKKIQCVRVWLRKLVLAVHNCVRCRGPVKGAAESALDLQKRV